MKKRLLFLFTLVMSSAYLSGQVFSDDFESYSVGDFLGVASGEWTTWSGNVGSSEDVRITDEKANSGDKSIKFSSIASSGGPQDVVLFYGGLKLTSGFLNSKMSMLVETGAYFNYQAETTIGTTWAMNAYFEEGGVGRITSSGNEPILQFSYPMNEWFEFEMDINFDANKWQLKVNGVCVGSFSNADNSIASIDIFPLQGNSFFIDDFAYEYRLESPEITEDASATLISPRTNGIAGDNMDITGVISNNGTTVVNSVDVEVEVNGSVTPSTLSGLDLAKGESVDFSLGEVILPAGNASVSVRISNVNEGAFLDQDLCNDEFAVELFGVDPSPNKKVVVEEATGTWCGFCPRGTVWMKRMENRYPDHFIGIAVHNDDPMVHPEYDNDLNAPGYPNALVNRGGFIDPSAIETPLLQEVTVPSVAILRNGASWEEDSRELRISLDVTAKEVLSDGYKVNIVVTEDGVTGTSSGYGQRNYFSGATDLIGDDGVNWRDLPSTVPAADMVYDHVARAILAPFTGLANSFEQGLQIDETQIFNFTYTVPEDFDLENMHIVSMLIEPDGTINTGESVTIEEAEANGYNQVLSTHSVALDNAVSIYPNPMNDFTTVDINLVKQADVQIEVLDLSGRITMQQTFPQRNGLFRTHVETAHLPVGTYIMKINTGDQYSTKRISVVH